MIDRIINLNLGRHAPPARVPCTEGDTGWSWHIRLWLDGQRWTIPSDAQLLLVVRKADGHLAAGRGTLTGNEAVVACTMQMTAARGPARGTLYVIDTDGAILGTAPMILDVAPGGDDLEIISGTDLTAIEEILSELAPLVQAAETVTTVLPGMVGDWLAANITEPEGVVIDKSLSVPNAVAEAVVVGKFKSSYNDDLITMTWAPSITRGSYIKTENGTVGSSSKYARTSALWNGSGIRKAIALNNPSYEFCLALYGDGGSLDGTGYLRSTDYATGMQYIPKDAAMFGVSFRRVDQSVLTADDSTAISAALSALAATDTRLDLNGKSADAAIVGAVFDEVGVMRLASFSWERGRIATTGATAVSDYDIRTPFIAVGDIYRSIRVIFNFPVRDGVTSNVLGVAEYSTNAASGYIKTTYIGYETDKDMTLDADTRYIKLYIRAYPTNTYVLALDDYKYMTVLWTGVGGISAALRDYWADHKPTDAVIPWLHTQPASKGAYNAIRRARQLTDFTWSPAESDKVRREFLVPAGSYEDTRAYGLRDASSFFDPAVEYVGAPYSGWHEIGTTVGLDTLYTAAKTPLSVFNERSYNIRDYGSPYYGSVCSNLVAYAISMPYLTTSAMVWFSGGVKKMMPGLIYLHDVVSNGSAQSMDDLELADILWVDGHCAMVTDLIKDNGHVTAIEVSEASMTYYGVCRRWTWQLPDFYAWFADFGVYRYTALDAVEYEPNVYAPMPDEGVTNKYAGYSVLPYYGNKCILNPTDDPTIKLIIRNVMDVNNGAPVPAFTHLVIEKNGEPFGAPIAIDAAQGSTPHYTSDITLDTDEAIYTAYLASYDNGVMSKRTDKCEWCVMPAHTPTVTFEALTLMITVNIKSPGFKPAYLIASSGAIDNRYAIHITPDMLTANDEQDGSVTYTIVKVYDDDRTIERVAIGYTSPEYGTKRELYSL